MNDTTAIRDGFTANVESISARIEDLITDVNTLEAALSECAEYFRERADAEYFTDSASPVGNEEMRLLVLAEEALKVRKR